VSVPDSGYESVARRFAGAYLRWEIGRAPLRDVRTLLELSTAQLAASSFDQPPRLLNPPPPARLVSVTVARNSVAPGGAVARAIIRRAGRSDRLTMALTARDSKVRVDSFVPPYGPRAR